MSDIYIIHALKELKLISKKLEKNRAQLKKYSSGLVNITPDFKTVDEQKKQVNALMMSSKDLVNRYLWLKKCLNYTNAVSKITIDGFTYSVVELIYIRKVMGKELDWVYGSLDNSNAQSLFARWGTSSSDKPQMILYYDEKQKNTEANRWSEFCASIDAELEIFNARTLLIDPDAIIN